MHAGELDNIQIDARDFEAGSSNVLVVSFTVNGMTAQRSITFTGECAPINTINAEYKAVLDGRMLLVLRSAQSWLDTVLFFTSADLNLLLLIALLSSGLPHYLPCMTLVIVKIHPFFNTAFDSETCTTQIVSLLSTSQMSVPVKSSLLIFLRGVDGTCKLRGYL